MDPITHTLCGATMAESGLKEHTALGTAALLVGANLPDLDVIAYAWDPTMALWFRRGVTHGVLGLLVLPVLLTGALVLWDRLVRRPRGAPPAVARRLFLLAFLAVLSHPILDSLNVYGMRWLMPFSDRWSYGDVLFIVDPWVWGMLAGGVVLSRRLRRDRPNGTRETNDGGKGAARASMLLVAIYVVIMAVSNLAARRIVAGALARDLGARPTRMMAAPLPANPFARRMVAQVGDQYHFGTLRWLPRPRFEREPFTLDAGPRHSAAAAATRGPAVRRFMSWARFPYFAVEDRGDHYLVQIGDARYTIEPAGSWASVEVEIGAGERGPGTGDR